MHSNIRNGLNLGFDETRLQHRALRSMALASMAFCAGTLTSVSVGNAAIHTLQDATRALFEARMDEAMSRHGLFDVLGAVDVRLFAAQMVASVGEEVGNIYGMFAQNGASGGNGSVSSLVDNSTSRVANDLIGKTGGRMDWLGTMLKIAAIGGTAFAAGYAISKASASFKAWFVNTSEEYFEKRKELLFSGHAVRSDILETRDRALRAYAGLLAFDRGMPRIEDRDLKTAQSRFGDAPLKTVIAGLQEMVHAIANEKARTGNKESVDFRSGSSGLQPRDIVREVIMNDMRETVNPFERSPSGADPAPETDVAASKDRLYAIMTDSHRSHGTVLARMKPDRDRRSGFWTDDQPDEIWLTDRSTAEEVVAKLGLNKPRIVRAEKAVAQITAQRKAKVGPCPSDEDRRDLPDIS